MGEDLFELRQYEAHLVDQLKDARDCIRHYVSALRRTRAEIATRAKEATGEEGGRDG